MKKIIIGSTILLAFISCSKIQLEPSFNCNANLNEIEKSICNNQKLIKLDLEMNKLYTKVVKKRGVKVSQRRWLKERNSKCSKATNISSCIEKSYSSRINFLRYVNTRSRSENEKSKKSKKPKRNEVVASLIDRIYSNSNCDSEMYYKDRVESFLLGIELSDPSYWQIIEDIDSFYVGTKTLYMDDFIKMFFPEIVSRKKEIYKNIKAKKGGCNFIGKGNHGIYIGDDIDDIYLAMTSYYTPLREESSYFRKEKNHDLKNCKIFKEIKFVDDSTEGEGIEHFHNIQNNKFGIVFKKDGWKFSHRVIFNNYSKKTSTHLGEGSWSTDYHFNKTKELTKLSSKTSGINYKIITSPRSLISPGFKYGLTENNKYFIIQTDIKSLKFDPVRKKIEVCD